MRRLRATTLLCLLVLLAPAAARAAGPGVPPIHHVYVIVLENEGASTTFGPSSPAPYLSRTLRAQGAYLPGYTGVGHASLDNYIAMISGQAPNASTQEDCSFFADFPLDAQGADGQQQGAGCVYPASVPTLAGQLGAAHLSWRSYNDSMGADPTREAATCGHPALNSQDHTQSATPTDQYASRHDPFVYFHSIIDDPALCNSHVVNLAPLAGDLGAAGVPNFLFITPSLCNDGHDAPCADGKPGGLVQADSFLRTWVPRITSSPAFRLDGGLLLVIFDEAQTSDTSSCCGEAPGPGSPSPGISGPGGGVTGAVALSPYIRPGHVDPVPYNHYGMLRSVEDIFGLGHLGYAAAGGLASFGRDLFACAPATQPVPAAGILPPGSEFTGAHIVRRHGRAGVSLNTVGASTLTVSVLPRHGRRQRRRSAVAPCRTVSFALPRGHGRVLLSAAVGAAAQSTALAY